MTLERQLDAAKAIAIVAHSGQKRKDGSPYFGHVERVADAASTGPGEYTYLIRVAIAGYLHDTVEDTSVTLEGLLEAGFDTEIVSAVDCLTRRRGEKYMETIERIAGNIIATRVKIADLKDNLLDQSALDPDEANFFNKRYTRALNRLLNGE